MNINELREKVKNGEFDDNELIDLVLYLERENQALLEENQKLQEQVDYLRRSVERKEDIITDLEQDRVPYTNEYVEKLEKENEKLHSYKTLYQSLKRQKEELRSWLKEDKDKIKVYDTKNNKAVELGIVLGVGMCVDKMEELEGVSNE